MPGTLRAMVKIYHSEFSLLNHFDIGVTSPSMIGHD